MDRKLLQEMLLHSLATLIPDGGVIGEVVRLLDADNPKVRARALGTVHNLSTDARSIGIIRKEVGARLGTACGKGRRSSEMLSFARNEGY